MGNKQTKSNPLSEELCRMIATADIEQLIRFFTEYPYYLERPLTDNLHTPLMYACLYNQLAVVQLLVECYPINLSDTDYNGMTPLHLCVYGKSVEILDYLCRKGANPFIKTQSGVTPKGMAFSMNYTKGVRVLEFYENHGPWAALTHVKKLIWLHRHSSLFQRLSPGLIREISHLM